MTVLQILERVCQQKRISRVTLYNYFDVLEIKPVGARQRPARYPDDAADKVLEHLGLPHVMTMPQLRSARRNSRRGTR